MNPFNLRSVLSDIGPVHVVLEPIKQLLVVAEAVLVLLAPLWAPVRMAVHLGGIIVGPGPGDDVPNVVVS